MKPPSKTILTFAAFLSLAAAPNLSKAAVALTYDSGEPAFVEQGNTGNIGIEFTVGSSAINVTQVAALVSENNSGTGVLDNNNGTYSNIYDTGGLSSSDFTVNFYDLGTATLLGSFVVPTGTAVDSNGFAYISIPTLTIAAGTDLGFTEFIGDSGDSASVVTPYGIDYNNSTIFSTGSGLTYVDILDGDGSGSGTYNPNDIPTVANGAPQLVTSNFIYDTASIPEPSTVALSAFGLGLLFVLGRRAVRKSA